MSVYVFVSNLKLFFPPCGIGDTLIILWFCAPSGSVATAEDPAAIATIQSAATFTDQPIKYLFKTEGAGGQVGRSVDLRKTII